MQLALPDSLPLDGICRGMGQPADVPADAPTLALAAEAAARVLAAARPLAVWRMLPVQWEDKTPRLAGTALPGRDIALHLRGCDECAVLAVTLGAGCDQILRRLSAGQVALAAAADSAASLLVEQMADQAEAAVRAALPPGRYLTGRYSPGYGDLPLALQPFVAELVNARRAVGLAVSSAGILIPRKSITALLGASDHPVKGHRAGCAHCALRDTCQYRKEGTTCADQ